MECSRKGKTASANTVHHCEPDNAERFYEATNLISLCTDCHNKMHNRITNELTELGLKWKERSTNGKIKRLG
ncbi:HNH endonuclease [Tyzzerella sp. OttesenSCG-928-J15]|nr:HNH endonuclease [Tyzzerella sp. OttesenSCG-928-J15]